MTKYSTDRTPFAPVAEITIRNTQFPERSKKVRMLLDTGSDITLLPKAACRDIGVILEDRFVRLIAFDGSSSEAVLVSLDLVFLKKLTRGEFYAYDQDEGMIGRDMLNQFELLFDGPNAQWGNIRTSSNLVS